MTTSHNPTPEPNVLGNGSLKNALEMTGCESEEDLIDMANVGTSLMERIDSLVSMPGPYNHWSPAEDPAEIVFDLVNDLDELTEENTKLKAALERISSPTQTTDLLWWQVEARAALAAEPQNKSTTSDNVLAWMRRQEDGSIVATGIPRVAEIWRDQGCVVTPLYEHPTPEPNLEDAKVWNVAADDENGHSQIMSVDWMTRQAAEKVVAHLSENYIGKPYPNGKGHYSIANVRLIREDGR